jgi:hypothetical protein
MSLDLEAIKALCGAATEGPWEVRKICGERYVFSAPDGLARFLNVESGALGFTVQSETDCAFVAAARTALPALIAELSAARAVVEAAKEYKQAHSFIMHPQINEFRADLFAALADYEKVGK